MSDDLPDHTNYSLIKAVDESGNFVTVLCDASGRIVSVMKGDYAGTMKTLAVDDKGRIQAVLTDPEDVFGNPNYIGAGELAARLGSIKNFEHRGQVVWMDDFEGSVLRFESTLVGAGAAVALSTAQSLSGIQSVKITSGTGHLGHATIYRYLSAPRSTKVGLEFAFTTQTNISYITAYATIYDGSDLVRGWFKVDYSTGHIYYRNSAGTWVDTGFDAQLTNNDRLFRRLKFVFDYSTQEWVRAFFDNEIFDMSGIAMQTSSSATLKQLYVAIALYGDEAHNCFSYVDDVIVTHNEP